MASHQRINPSSLFDSSALAYSQISVASGKSIVHIAGQASINANLEIIGEGDFATQTVQVFRNLGLALVAADVTPQDVLSVKIYVVGLQNEYIPILKDALLSFFGADTLPPGTLLGIAALAMPGLLLEVEAVATK